MSRGPARAGRDLSPGGHCSALVGSLKSMSDSANNAQTKAWGFGLATLADDGSVLDTWYPAPALGEPPAEAFSSCMSNDSVIA